MNFFFLDNFLKIENTNLKFYNIADILIYNITISSLLSVDIIDNVLQITTKNNDVYKLEFMDNNQLLSAKQIILNIINGSTDYIGVNGKYRDLSTYYTLSGFIDTAYSGNNILRLKDKSNISKYLILMNTIRNTTVQNHILVISMYEKNIPLRFLTHDDAKNAKITLDTYISNNMGPGGGGGGSGVVTNHSQLVLNDGTNPHGTTKSDVGLGNVDNTSDINKPISNATQNALDDKVDKIPGMGLSQEDFTTTLKDKLDGIESGAEVNVQSDWNQTNNTFDDYIKNKPVNLSEFNNDLTFITTETDPIFTASEASNFVTGDKDKLDGIEVGAEVNVQSDWNQTNNTFDDYIKNKPTKTSDFDNDGSNGTSTYVETNELGTVAFSNDYNDLDNKIEMSVNLSFYPTTTNSDIVGYNRLVTSLDDPDYDTNSVDINTGIITTTSQLISQLVSDVNIIEGNPGIINITTIGEIRKISGSGNAEFYFEIYKRDILNNEVIIGVSNKTPIITTNIYQQFQVDLLFNNGTWTSTDRLVIKYYADRISGGSNPEYQFLFGGSNPVRTLFPVSASLLLNVPIVVGITEVKGGTSGKVLITDSSGKLEELSYTPASTSDIINNHSELTLDDGTNPHGTTKSDVGLGNVDNTSDIDKPISTATQNALSNKADLVGGKVPTSQLPSYVDDVIEGYFNGSNFYTDSGFTNLITPESGKIYINIAVTPATQYRWSGSSYTQIGSNTNTTIINQAGVTHTITSDDVKSKLIVFNSSLDVVLTIPNNSVLPLEIGSNFSVVNKGSGSMKAQADAGVTIRTKNNTLAVSNDVRKYVKLSENEWLEDTDFEQIRFVPLSVYLDIINGNDSTAKIEDSKKPFKTMVALISALPATTGETFTIYITGGTIPITRKMPIRNLNFVAYSATTLDFTNCKEDDGVTDATLVLSTFGSTLYNASTVAPNWNFSGTNISLICTFVGRKIFSHIDITSWNQVGLSLTGTINKLDWRSTATNPHVVFGGLFLKTANLIINELYDSSQVRPNFYFTGHGGVNYPAVITIRKLILSYRNYMCAYVTGNSGFSASIIIDNVIEAVTNSNQFRISASFAKVGNVTMNGTFSPGVGTIEFAGTLSSGCTINLNGVNLIQGVLNSTTYCYNDWLGNTQTFRNFSGKLNGLATVAGAVVLENCNIEVNDYLIHKNAEREDVLYVKGFTTIKQNNTSVDLFRNHQFTPNINPKVLITIDGRLNSNVKSYGKNARYINTTSTFKEKEFEVIIRSKKDLIGRELNPITTYVVDGTLILNDGEYIEIPLGGLTLAGYGFDVSKIQKNVSGQSIFKSPVGGSGNLVSKDIEYNSGLGSVFDITDSNGSHAIEFNDVNFVGCNSLGLINGYRQFTATTCGIYGCTSGFVLDGTWTGFKMVNTNAFSFGATGKLFSAGSTLTFSNRFFIELNLSLPIGAVIADFIDANFLNNKLLQVTNCFIKVNGVIDPDYTPVLFPGITPNSVKSYFVNNIGLRNTPIEPYSMRGSNFRVCDDDLEASSQDVAVGEFYIETTTGYLRQRLT